MSDPGAANNLGYRGLILVVDDLPANRMLLHDLLELDGHEIIEAADGYAALALATQRDPDVILLDVNMPGIDGFEVCRRLRAETTTAVTPVLLVTGLSDREYRIQGMSAGANDYLVKPIDRGEVSLRVRNAVRMRLMHRALDQQFRSLQKLERMRDDLVSMLAHDLRSPLTGLRGFLELLQVDLQQALPHPMDNLLIEAIRSVDQLNAMIGDMLDVSRMEADALPITRSMTELRSVAMRAVAALGPQPPFHHVPIIVSESTAAVACDSGLIQRVLINLLANAIRFSPTGSEVHVTVTADQSGASVRVRDHGPGIPPQEQERIFDKFMQSDDSRATRVRHTGLGLTFCRMVIERHDGRIGVISGSGGGSEFWFWLPAEIDAERGGAQG